MTEGCTHNCATCHADCGKKSREEMLAAPHKLSNVKRVFAVVSGKGGVGKSTVTSLLAVAARKKGLNAAVLDADITGPSIPKAFGVDAAIGGGEDGIFPAFSKTGIQMISVNLLLEDKTDPVLWRGPVIAGTVKQFWTDVIWNDVDVMFIDMPPGTGDVPLTVFQSIPVDGIIVVTSPQQLVGMIVEKAVKMAGKMDIPVLGLIENMAYYVCKKCGEKEYLFGQSNSDEIAEKYAIPSFIRLPIDPDTAALCDNGDIESAKENKDLNGLLETLLK